MNPESTNPQEELEIRMVALLLGELSEAEAAELEAKIAADPALQGLRDRLAATLGLVREAALSPLENSGAPMEAMKLSAAKREKLLATFKTVPLPVVAKSGAWKRYAPLGLAAALVGLVSLAVFRFGKLGMSSSDSYARNYQGSADLAPVQWADSEKRESAGGVYPGKVVGFGVTTNAVVGGFGRTPPRESSELVLSYDFAQPAGAPLPTTASGPLAEKQPVQQPLSRNESLAFQNDSAQRGGQAGQTWEFYAKDANGPLGESLVVAGQVDSLATVNGPATADGTKSFFRSIQAADTLSAAGAATGDRTASASATPRSYFDDQLGRKPNADLPVLSDQPMAGRLFREPAVAGVPITGLAEESELKRTEATANRSQLASQAETSSRWFGGLAGGARGGVEAVSAPANVPPSDVQVHARFSEMAQTDAKSVDFDKSLGNAVQPKDLFGDASTAGKSESVAGVNGVAVDGLRDLSAKADAKPLADESRFGFQSVRAENERLAGELNSGVILPSSSLALQPSRDGLDRAGELKERSDTQVALGLERGERTQARGRVLQEELVREKAKEADVETESFDKQQAALARDYHAKQAELQRRLSAIPNGGVNQEESERLRQSLKKESTELREQAVERFEKMIGVDEQKRIISALKLRLDQEKIELQLPMESVVTIHDKAFASDSANKGLLAKLGEAVTGKKSASARISVDKDKVDVEGLSVERPAVGYDPFFLQTEFEKITSQAVLDGVVDELGLEEKFAKERGLKRNLSREEARKELKERLTIKLSDDTSLIEIKAKSSDGEEAARIANTVAGVYKNSRLKARRELKAAGIESLEKRLAERELELAQAQEAVKQLPALVAQDAEDAPPAKPQAPAPVPQPEVATAENAFSTFSLNVSDVSFKLAAASLEQGRMPEAASIRAEEFLNAFDYRDPLPTGGAPMAFAWDRARSPFEHNRDLLRLSLRTAAAGRSAAQPLNLVLLLDNSGSMERADRVGILREALKVLAGQLRPEDRLSVVTFARTALLRADGVDGAQAAAVFGQLEGVVPEGGTNLEEAMGVAYATAQRHFFAHGVNRVVLLTDGAANLGNVEPDALKRVVETNRKQGVALDCFGVGWEGFNDDLLETLSRNGDGRYGFLNSPEEAAGNFAQQLAGALQVAASDVKVQVEFNPKRVTAHRQIGYAKHQLTKEQFRDNTVDAAEIGAAEAGNALYTLAVNPQGEGPLATVRVRFKVPGTQQYREQAWEVPFNGASPALETASPSMRLAASAGAFAEWLAGSPFAAEVKPEVLARLLQGVPETFGADGRAKTLAEMVSAAGRLAQ